MIHNKEIEKAIMRHPIIEDRRYIENYIERLERDNCGLKSTNEHLKRRLQLRLYGKDE